MSIAQPQIEQRVLLRDVSWHTYGLLRDADENYHLRMTYDRGVLEIMSPSRKHERIAYLLGRMIDQWTMAHDIDLQAGRNTTFRREDLQRGLEPDNCYWISHELAVRDKEELDLNIDPPPDLAIEVDITQSSLWKLPIYATLGVPEVWRWRGGQLEVLRLDRQREYQPRKSSLELPRFPLRLAGEILADCERLSDTAVVRKFLQAIQAKR
jgi:Uma2 family endonuclease